MRKYQGGGLAQFQRERNRRAVGALDVDAMEGAASGEKPELGGDVGLGGVVQDARRHGEVDGGARSWLTRSTRGVKGAAMSQTVNYKKKKQTKNIRAMKKKLVSNSLAALPDGDE